MKNLLLSAALCALAAPAYATGAGTLADPITSGCDASGSFCILPGGPDADDLKMFLDEAKNTDLFFGSTTGNGSHFTDTIKINTTGFVDTSSGFATIKPLKDGTLTDVVYTPQAKNLFDGFFTRGQLVFTDPAPCAKNDHSCVPTAVPDGAWVDMQVNGGPIFSFFEALPEKNDFADIGFDEVGDPNAGLISKVEIWVPTANVSFFQVEQANWSPCDVAVKSACDVGINLTGGVPELPTWAMGLMGFGLVGFTGLYRTRKPARYAL